MENIVQTQLLPVCASETIIPTETPRMSHFGGPITTTIPHASLNIERLHQKITSDGGLLILVDDLRELPTKKERAAYKAKHFEFVTPSGTFSYRNDDGIMTHSGYLCVDIDELESTEKLTHLKERLQNNQHIPIVLVFISPSGDGLKAFLKIPPVVETHGHYFDALENYFQKIYGVNIDKKCRNVSRACYLSYDEDAYLAPGYLDVRSLGEDFLEQWMPEQTSGEQVQASELPVEKVQQHQQLTSLIEKIVAQQRDITTDYEQWMLIGFALCELGEDGRKLFHQVSQFYPQYDEMETNEKYTQLLHRYDGSTKLGTLFHIAKQNGITFSISEQVNQMSPDALSAASLTESLSSTRKTSSTPRSANQRLEDAQNASPIKQLVGSLWNTGEVCILFGDNGTGKSVWALQIADALSKGVDALSILPNQCGPCKVLFYDFELSDAQFFMRYQDNSGKPYKFSDQLYTDRIDFSALRRRSTHRNADDVVYDKIVEDIHVIKPEVLVIDNLSYLQTDTTQDAKVALNLMGKLMHLKDEYQLSILVLAHTPKVKPGVPISKNDLAGSKNLSNFADTISAIGKSNRSEDEKYIKHIKCRTGGLIHGTENVITCKLQKDGAFLRFDFISCEHEREHLRSTENDTALLEKQEKKIEALELHEQGMSVRAIAEQIGVSKSTVQRWIQEVGN